MGKRSNFKRNPRDFYPTPAPAVEPLLPFLAMHTNFYEPCAGEGDLISHLEAYEHICVGASDIKGHEGVGDIEIVEKDALKIDDEDVYGADYIISNTPWKREILHPMITHFTSLRPTWLLFDADWLHTKQAIPYLPLLEKVVSVGRLKWIPGSKHTGKENCCWFFFNSTNHSGTRFFGRTL